MGKFPSSLLLIGDSLIEFYDWQARFSDRNLYNLGRSGETAQELLQRLETVIKTVPAPDWLLTMTGTNNVLMEDFTFFAPYREIIATLKTGYPHATVSVNALFPMSLPWLAPSALPRLNAMLKQLAGETGASFLDPGRAFLNEKGALHPGYFLPDGVHLSERGYEAWATAIEQAWE